MRILLAYPGHAFSTYDVAQGYHRGLTAAGHIVQAFDYHTRLAFYDHALSAWQESNPNFSKDTDQVRVLASEAILPEIVDFHPDVVFVINGTALHPRAYQLMWRMGVPYVMLLTESPYADDLQTRMIQAVRPAAVFTNERNSAQPLADATGIHTVYLPHAYDPERHTVTAVPDSYVSDVFFFGTLWPERERLFASLLGDDSGRYRIGGVEISGSGAVGVMSNDELVRWYNGTSIALNHHRTFVGTTGEGEAESHIGHTAAWSLGPRAYEIAACGAFQLCDDSREELTAVFGDAVATYSDATSLTANIENYLGNRELRLEMASAAREAVRPHTFENRVKGIIDPTLSEVI